MRSKAGRGERPLHVAGLPVALAIVLLHGNADSSTVLLALADDVGIRARRGNARNGAAGRGLAVPGLARLGQVRQDKDGRGEAWQGGVRHGVARPGSVWPGEVWQGGAWRGLVRLGRAWPGRVWQGWAVQG